jgi:ATP-binding cassette, subfamily B, bacterial
MKLLLSYLSHYKKLIFFTFLLAAVNQIFSLFDPMIFGKIIDLFAKNPKQYDENTFIKGVGFLILCSMGVAMVSRIAKAFQDYCTNIIIQKFGARVYTDGLRHSLKLPYQAFEDQRSGETLNVLQKVRTDTERFIMSFINVIFISVVGISFVMVYAAQVYAGLIPVYIIASFILGFVINKLSKKVKLVQTTIVKETNLLAGSTTESLRNIELIKSLGLTEQEIIRLNAATQKILGLELKKVRTIRTLAFFQGTLVNSLRQVILFILVYLIFKDKVSVGQLMTLQFYSFFIFNPLQEVGNVILSYREAEASLANFEKIINSPIEEKPANPTDIGEINALSFQNVSFQHQTARTKALSNIDFSVKKGETVAFVGPSGSGKTTLVKLLVGLYRAKEGNILYNGIDSEQIDVENIRHQIGFVTQDTQLFSGTIRENLLFVNPNATEAEMYDVLEKSACSNLLDRSDKGLDTVIGEGGMKVSGGEKQRLSIARALLRKPKLFVFDEATSALDSITEDDITQTVRAIASQRDHITIMIAHRLSTIMHADKIYVLEKGEIIEAGKHESLLAEKGLYYAMWRQQIGERKNS